MNIDRKITRIKGRDYCTLEIELKDGQLSICGEAGEVLTPRGAKIRARQYWESYFDEDRSALHAMNDRCGTNFRSSRSAAKYVLQCDGDYHGLDARKMDGKVFCGHSWGQIRNELREFFPEVEPLLPYHLNYTRPGCECSEKLGWKHGKTIALAADTLTIPQALVIETDLMKACEEKQAAAIAERTKRLSTDRNFAIDQVKKINNGLCSVTDLEWVMQTGSPWTIAPNLRKKVLTAIKSDVEKEIQPEKFEAAIYKDCIGAPCPTCGEKYGYKWFKRELPSEIIELAANVCKGKEDV